MSAPKRKPARKPREWRVWVWQDVWSRGKREEVFLVRPMVDNPTRPGGIGRATRMIRARLVLDQQRAPKARRK